jgi:PTS system beta-glucosides-specific IIC component
MDYKGIAQFILINIGGESNVNSVTHCATRLRFILNDTSLVNEVVLNESDDVIQAFSKSGQYQIIIGTEVLKIYEALLNITETHINNKQIKNDVKQNKGNLISRFFNTISSIFTPLLPALAGSGVLRGILLLLAQIGWIDEKSGTYIILSAASMSVFYFLPILLSLTSAKRFKVNPYIAAIIGASLIHPDLIKMLGGNGNGATTSFMGIPVILMNYSSTVIPAILAIWAYSYMEKFLEKYIWKNMQIILVPLISLALIVPLTVILFGPFGVYVGEWIADAINWMSESNGWVTGTIVGGVWNVFVVFGLQWAVNPIMINNVSTIGFDKIVPLTAAANFGMAGAAFAVMFKSKDKKMKSFSLSALLSIFLAGITEPAIYGVGMKLKRPFIGALIGGGVGGAYIGGMGVKSYAFVFGGLTTLPAFVGATFIHYIIGLAICFIVGTLATFILGFKDTNMDTREVNSAVIPESQTDEAVEQGVNLKHFVVKSPLKGKVITLEEIGDGVFSKKLLGEGVAIVPEKSEVHAPISGEVVTVFPTKHAYGIRGDNNIEILVHLGIDTVELNGEHFTSLVEQGQRVEQGDRIAIFDIEKIKPYYQVITPIVVTNSDKYDIKAINIQNKVDKNKEILVFNQD